MAGNKELKRGGNELYYRDPRDRDGNKDRGPSNERREIDDSEPRRASPISSKELSSSDHEASGQIGYDVNLDAALNSLRRESETLKITVTNNNAQIAKVSFSRC